MKRSESRWAIAIQSKRAEWLREETVSRTRKAAWQKMLDLYSEAFRDAPAGDPARLHPESVQGYRRFHEDRDSGRIRAVRVDLGWEATR